MIFRFLLDVLREIFGLVKSMISSILGDKKITIATGIFLIILCRLFTYRAMMEEFDFEARMRRLLPWGVIVGVIALSTIVWTRK